MKPALALPSEMTIYSVADVRRRLLAHVDSHAEDEACRLDGGAVDQVDAAGVQLLVSLARTLAPLGRTLQLGNASPVLQAACESLGLSQYLLDPGQERAAA
jgi:anti-anti-sigma regulatory factor